MSKIVTHGPGIHVGDPVLAYTLDGDRIVEKMPKVIEGFRLATHRPAGTQQILATGDDLKACACNRLDISHLPFASEAYDISPNIEDYVMVEVPIVVATFPNRNLDAFPYEELVAYRPLIGRTAYATFVGKPVHQDHDNEEPLRAKGIILDATLAKFRGKWHVKILKAFDRSKDPALAKKVAEKDRVGHSMGALVEETECSIPSCRFISDGVNTCEHIAQGAGKGRIIGGQLVYELLRRFNYVESSSVSDPAYVVALTDFFL